MFTGFGAGYFTAGGPFVWTLLLAAAVFVIWTLIAADLTAKIPLAGYSYQWTSRLVGSTMALFTGVLALAGWICGMTGVGFILSGYLGSLFGWNMSQTAQIFVAIGVMAVCMLINLYGVRFATMVNNIGVSLEFVITVGATILVAIVAFSSPDNHQSVSVLFTGGTSDGSTPYVLAWLAASLGPFFGLIGVEASADIAEETKDARRVIPRTMFYALTASIIIEFGMYVVYVLAIKDASAVEAASAAPIEEIITQQVGPVISKIVVAVALTNVLACILANILVATRLTYSMARDNMLPFSHVWRHVSPSNRTPTYAVLGIFGFSTVLLLFALVSEKAFFLILGLSSLAVCAMYLLQTDRRDDRHPPWNHPGARAGNVRPRQGPRAGGRDRGHRLHPGVRRADLPAAVRGQRLRVRWPARAHHALGLHRAAQATGHRRSRTGLRQDPHLLKHH